MTHRTVPTRRVQLLTAAVALLLASATSAAAQQVIRVPQDAGTLGQAIQQIGNGGVIEMAGGTYTAPSGGFRVRFPGKGFTIRAASGANVVLSGQGTTNIFFYEDSGTNRTLTFENLVFENGFADAETIAGGVSILGGATAFAGCTFRNNAVRAPTTGGGAVRVSDGGNAIFRNSVFEDNSATSRGGGLAVVFASATVRRSRFTRNRVNVPGHASKSVGGAIYALDSDVRVEESRFEDNEAGLTGGALLGFGVWEEPIGTPKTTLTVLNSTFVGNLAAPDPCCPPPAGFVASGGAIHVEDQTLLDIKSSRFLKNHSNWGGALSSYRSEVRVAESTFRGNFAELDGPFPPLGGTVVALASDFADSSTDGGAINRPPGHLTIENTLIQGRFEDVGATASLGGCVFAEGDISRVLGQNVPQDGSEADNRLPIDISGLILTDCEVDEPTAPGTVTGGGIAASLVDMRLSDSLISGNKTPTLGGGMAILPRSEVDITDTTFAANRADRFGGGLHVNGSHIDITNGHFLANEVGLPAGGAALFSTPADGIGRDVTGLVEGVLFADHANLPIVDGDRATGPINDVQYDGNLFRVATSGTDVYQNTIDFRTHNVAELNRLIINRANGTSTPKSQVDNLALTAVRRDGIVVAGPSIVLTESAVGDPTPPTSAFLGYAWTGPSATLAGQSLANRSGLLEIDEAGEYPLRVAGTVVDTATVEEVDSGPNCRGATSGLCLNGDRFFVEVSWRDSRDNTGVGVAVPAPSVDSGLMFFFGEDNWEMLIKVLDGCPINNHYWVFVAATTTVEYTLKVTDVVTGLQREYFNPLGNAAAAITDTLAFASCSESTARPPDKRPVIRLDQPPEGMRVLGDAAPSPIAGQALKGVSGCTQSPTGLFLNDDRFRVEVAWRDSQGNTGAGEVVPFCVADSGLFFFFDPDNWEMLVKVLDGCPINDRYWVFSAATTNVEYTLRVTDTTNGTVKTYFNRLGNAAAAITDTGAFATCP